ncbi:MGA_1079 family surface serine endopeptidase [Mycoplasma procyoni]|uniref:MGA_1079 family surface serine endopeptidase n=1 Tax=Mycoplasma procyoni TaxID=568784 RepID=UPI00197BF39F|nr:hypothetical protein [Mycoplasma procyoni]MBN3534862.1 hypothetical protein [Mycoplasma procyoni]
MQEKNKKKKKSLIVPLAITGAVLTTGSIAVGTTLGVLNDSKSSMSPERKQELLFSKYIENQPNKELDSFLKSFSLVLSFKKELNLEQKQQQIDNIKEFVKTFNDFEQIPVNKLNQRLNEKEEQISNKLKEINDFRESLKSSVLNKSFESTMNSVSDIKKNIEELNKLNPEIDSKNKELEEFATKINTYDFKNSALLSFVDKKFNTELKSSGDYDSLFNNLKSADQSLSDLMFMFNLFKDQTHENTEQWEQIKKEVESFDAQNISNFDNLSQIQTKITETLEKFRKYLVDNNIESNYITKKKENLLEQIKNFKLFSNEQKEQLKTELEAVSELKSMFDFEDKLKQNQQEAQKELDAFVSKIQDSPLESKFKLLIQDQISQSNTMEEIKAIEENFNSFLTKISELQNKISSFEQQISSNSIAQNKQYQYKKLKVEIEKSYKDSIWNNYDLQTPNNTISKISELINKIDEIEKQSDDNSKSVLDLFKDEALQNVSIAKIDERINAYSLNQYLYSASVTLQNAKLYFNNKDTEFIDYEISDLKLKESDKNTLVLTISATAKTDSQLTTTIEKEFSFSDRDINEVINQISVANLDALYTINYFELSKINFKEFSANENYKKYFTKKQTGIANFFNYELDSSFGLDNKKLKNTLKILYGKQVIKTFELLSENVVNFEADENDQQDDKVNKEKILSLLSGPVENLLAEIEIKPNQTQTHNDFYSKDAKQAFETLYNLPKYGKYEIYVEELVSWKGQKNSDKGGSADLFFWYKENGNKVALPSNKASYTKEVLGFKPTSYDAIEPLNKKFYSREDFVGSQFKTIEQHFISEIKKINETNFSHRKVQGKAKSKEDVTMYRALNVKDFIAQGALEKLNFFIELHDATKDSSVVGQSFENDWFVPLNAKIIARNGVAKSDAVISPSKLNDKLLNKYDYYFYDIRQVNKRSIGFKLGFINKEDSTKRFTTDKEYILDNFVNDFQQVHYPRVILNNIKLSDISVNQDLISQKEASYYTNNLEELNEAIGLKYGDEIEYENYSLPKNRFKIIALSNIDDDSAFVRFGFSNHDNSVIKGDVWYKIKGFKSSSLTSRATDFAFENQNLKTIFYSENEIRRERILEPYWKDLEWTIDKDTNVASWVLDKKYIENTLLTETARHRSIRISLFGNAYVADKTNNRQNRIKQENHVPKFDLDFEKLARNEEIFIEGKVGDFSVNVDGQTHKIPEIAYIFSAKYNPEKGIEISFQLKNKEQKIVSGYLGDQPEDQVFSNERAFFLAYAPAKIYLKYTNSLEHEDFGWIKTNQYNYKQTNYDIQNQPFLHYNDDKQSSNHNIYNPNQNVIYKIHEGYKPDREWIRAEWKDWDLVNSVKARSIKYVANSINGSGSMIGKVNDDPNDGRFYLLTNHHVEKEFTSLNQLSGDSLPSKDVHRGFMIYSDRYANNVLNGYRYGATENEVGFGRTISNVLWVGVDNSQISKDGTERKNYDAAVSVVDINPVIKYAKEHGNFGLAKHLQNWFKLAGIKMNFRYEISEIYVPVLRDMAHNGFPAWGLKTGYVNHRPEINGNTTVFEQSPDFSTLQFGSGNSGTGIQIGNGEFASLWTSGGIPTGSYSVGWQYDSPKYNLFGINWEGENPLELKNTNSLGGQILRANAKNPNQFNLPWFFREIKN